MKLLLFLFGAALAAGLYFVLADLLKIPRLATERALISAGRKERSLVKSLEALILGWALKLAPLIRLDAYKRRRLETKLTAAGLDMTPRGLYGLHRFEALPHPAGDHPVPPDPSHPDAAGGGAGAAHLLQGEPPGG